MKTCEIVLTNGQKALYVPRFPCADNEELAKTQRVILRHGSPSEILVAPIGLIVSGWVIGIDAAKGD